MLTLSFVFRFILTFTLHDSLRVYFYQTKTLLQLNIYHKSLRLIIFAQALCCTNTTSAWIWFHLAIDNSIVYVYAIIIPSVWRGVSEDSPGGRDCLSFSAFSLSVMTKVYRYLLQRTLNFTLSLFFLILTAVGTTHEFRETPTNTSKHFCSSQCRSQIYDPGTQSQS